MSYSIRVTVLLASFAFCAAPSFAIQQSSQQRHKIEFHLAETEPASGLTEATTKDKGVRIHLHKEVIVSESDIREVHIAPNQSSPFFEIALHFTDEGARKMADATKKHIGKLLAIVIDGEVVTAPQVTSVIEASGQITGQFTREEAERITKVIADSLPPFLSPRTNSDQTPIKIELRLAELAPAKDLVEAPVERPPYRKVYLYKEVLISNEDIIEARAVKGYREGIFDVELLLTQKAGEKFANAIEAHIGGMLAELINGKVVSTPYIIGRPSRTPSISGEFSKEEAETIVRGFNQR